MSLRRGALQVILQEVVGIYELEECEFTCWTPQGNYRAYEIPGAMIPGIMRLLSNETSVACPDFAFLDFGFRGQRGPSGLGKCGCPGQESGLRVAQTSSLMNYGSELKAFEVLGI